MADRDKTKKVDQSRRDFLKKSGYVAGGVVGGGILGSLIGSNFAGEKEQAQPPVKEVKKYQNALMYFQNQREFKTLAAATERIFPQDENGPGAIELDVPYFIDHQLAGSYGRNDQEYMQGPFAEGSPYQGYQTPLKRHEIFSAGIRKLEEESQKEHQQSFVDLEGDQQDHILETFEEGKVKMKGVKSSQFFSLLRSATLAGVYADPLYGGNADMAGWKMKEYPGSQMSYKNDIQKDEFIEMEASALNDHL